MSESNEYISDFKSKFTPPTTEYQKKLIADADCGRAMCEVCKPNFNPDSRETTLGANMACQGVIGGAQPLQTLNTHKMMSGDSWDWEDVRGDLKYYSSFYEGVKKGGDAGNAATGSYQNDKKCATDAQAQTEECNVWTRGNTNFNRIK